MTLEELDAQNQQVVSDLFRLLNIMGNQQDLRKLIGDRLATEHRTIQQSFVGTVAGVISDYADVPGEDLRNADAKAFARKVKELGAYFRYV